jgi:thiamine biosynthesis protein ThiS
MTPSRQLTTGMEITVNGQPRELEPDATVATLLETLGLDPRQLAVERNLELVPRAAHAKTALAAGDRVEVVTLVGGG